MIYIYMCPSAKRYTEWSSLFCIILKENKAKLKQDKCKHQKKKTSEKKKKKVCYKI